MKLRELMEMADLDDMSSGMKIGRLGADRQRKALSALDDWIRGGDPLEFTQFLYALHSDPSQLKDADKKKQYKNGGQVRGNALEKGMQVLATYNQYNQGAEAIEILGITDDNDAIKGSREKVVWTSVRAMLKAKGFTSLKALYDSHLKVAQDFYQAQRAGKIPKYEKLDQGNPVLYTRDMTNDDEGAWYYLFEGRWARGSGAEKLSFYKLVEV